MKGVVRTKVGYAGGTKEDPTYKKMGDHTEVVRVVYNPEVTSYQTLLKKFWAFHKPTVQSPKRQYWNAVFYHDEKQKELAEQTRNEIAEEHEYELTTKVLPVRSFTRAETYHQKYYLQKKNRIMSLLSEQFSEADELLDSTVATRANALVADQISEKQFQKRVSKEEYVEIPGEALGEVEAILCGSKKQ